MKFILFLFIAALALALTPECSSPPHGTVLEKLHFPPHIEHKFETANGEWLCPEEPSNNVYLIEVRYTTIADQWILKVSVNTNGVRREVFAKCDFNTWHYSNSIGKPLSGMISLTPVCW